MARLLPLTETTIATLWIGASALCVRNIASMWKMRMKIMSEYDYTGNHKGFLYYTEKVKQYGWTTDLSKVYECPVCHGYGGWYVREHLSMSCSQCNGHGYVYEKNPCIHKWVHVRETGRCLNLYKCEKCGAFDEVDSGD